jgi:hypothetical protein
LAVCLHSSDISCSYLRLNLQGLTGAVNRAALRLFANRASASGINIHGVRDNVWTELAIHYNNAPPVGDKIGSFRPVGARTWIRIDVSAYIIRNGSHNLALTTPGTTAISIASRQAGANAPQLIVETAP